MDYDAILAEVLAPLHQKTGERCCGGYCIRTGRRYPLKIRLRCRMHVSKLLRIKSFHGVSAGNARQCSLKPRIGKVRDELRDISIVKDGAPGQLQLHWHEQEGLSFTTELPPSEQIFALLHCLRPFVLENEDTNFLRLANTIGRRADNNLIHMFLCVQKDRYLGKHSQQVVRIFSNDVVINCEAILQQWLSEYEYHRDADKRREVERLHQLLPLEASRAIFVTMLYDKVDAVRNLHSLVRLILGKQDTWTCTAGELPIYHNDHPKDAEMRADG